MCGGKGKIKLVAPNIQESRKEASITFSDKNNPISDQHDHILQPCQRAVQRFAF